MTVALRTFLSVLFMFVLTSCGESNVGLFESSVDDSVYLAQAKKYTPQDVSEDIDVSDWDSGQIKLKKSKKSGIEFDKKTKIKRRIVRVAMLLPTGDTRPSVAVVANSIYEAAQLALSDMRFKNQSIRLAVYDTSQGASLAASDAARDGANIVLGPLFSDDIEDVRRVFFKRGIPVISFSNRAEYSGNGVYVMGVLPGQEVCRVMDFAASKGYRKFAIFSPEGSYGDLVVSAASNIVGKLDSKIVEVVRYKPDYKDIANKVEKYANHFHPLIEEDRKEQKKSQSELGDLSRSSLNADGSFSFLEEEDDGPKVDAILLADSGKILRGIAAYLAYYDVDPEEVKLLGLSGWKAKVAHEENIFQGGWFSFPYSKRLKIYTDAFESVYGYKPEEISAIGYDAMAAIGVMASEAEKYGDGDLFNKKRFVDSAGFMGAMGTFRFAEMGSNQRNMSIMEVSKNSFNVIDPSRKSGFHLHILSEDDCLN